MNSRRYNVFAWLGVLLLLAVSAPAVMVSRTIMFYTPDKFFGDGLKEMKVREANASITPPSKSSDWWSVTFTKDSSQYNFEFNQNNYDVFFQLFVGENSNQCFDMNGWRRSDQNCTAKFMNMGKWPNDTMWIVPDKFKSLYKPDTFFTNPVFKTFYFLPPNDEEWNQGRAQVVINNGTPVNMNPDDRDGACGWFQMRYINADPPTDVYFVLSSDNDIQIGQNGVEEDVPTHINLKDMFASLGGNEVYFEADGGSSGWSSTYSGNNGSCGYPLAALIYDTDASMHGAFSCDAYPNEGTNGCYTAGVSWPTQSSKIPCIGVTKGMVGATLDPTTKKPKYNDASGCFESEDKFNQLFTETDGVNVKQCVDINFSRSVDGLWEYDSMNEKDQGYYPLEGEPNSGASTKRTAYGGVKYGTGEEGTTQDNLNAEAVKRYGKNVDWAAIDDATGVPFIDLYPSQDGEFASGKFPNVYDNTSWDLRVGKTSPMKRNQHFCFETHGTFEYQKGQSFYFRGDDDIWVYIDNRLVVDLGGMHLAAPDYVNLDTMGLKLGTKYDIDIFFCDRRTDMSNIRIKTNMYFSQNNGLFTQAVENDTAALEICKMSGSTSSCDALLSGNSAAKTECGADIQSQLRYFLTSRRAGDTLWLADTNKNCTYDNGLVCYGGVKIGAGKVSVDKSKIKGLAGTYIVWAQLIDPTNPLKVRIVKFTTKTNVAVITSKADVKGIVKDLAPPAQVVAGKLVPVYFASGDLSNGTFLVDDEGGVGKTFQLNTAIGALGDAASSASLQIYRDSLGTVEALSSEMFTIGAGGLCTLWVKGNYQATENYTYSINVNQARTAALSLQVMQPTLQFRDSLYASPVTASGPWQKGTIPYMGEVTNRYLVALDPVSGEICSTCSFALSSVSEETSATFANPVGISTVGMVAGKAVVGITGNEVVDDPNFASVTVRGLSPLTAANWDSLRFAEPPVPVPVLVNLFDKNGDGKGDSLVIHYHRAIPSADSLADKLSIVWPAGTTDTLVIPKSELSSYWKQGYPDSMLVIADRDFSEEILTAGKGSLINTATFKDPETNLDNTVRFSRDISDKMGPVIVRASYSAPKTNCGSSQANACLDQIKVEFSEAVSLDSTHVSELGNLFLFRLTDQGALGWRADFPPKSMSRSDSTALLVFERYKDHPTPVALDSIKIRGTADETPLLRDLNGNYPSPRQVGAKIEGVKPLEIQTVYIGDLNVDDPAIRQHLEEDPIAIYPVNPGSDLDSIAVKYPGTVGHIIKLDIPGKLFTAGVKPDPANVKVFVDNQYFTNLGGYVAKGKQTIPCTDAIFKGNCVDNSMYLYVAWNMTTDDHRFVGSGAYISVLDFHWTMKVGAVESSEDSKKVREIVGVRRGAGVIK